MPVMGSVPAPLARVSVMLQPQVHAVREHVRVLANFRGRRERRHRRTRRRVYTNGHLYVTGFCVASVKFRGVRSAPERGVPTVLTARAVLRVPTSAPACAHDERRGERGVERRPRWGTRRGAGAGRSRAAAAAARRRRRGHEAKRGATAAGTAADTGTPYACAVQRASANGVSGHDPFSRGQARAHTVDDGSEELNAARPGSGDTGGPLASDAGELPD
jgi:hypothetical protein